MRTFERKQQPSALITFDDHVPTKASRPARNADTFEVQEDDEYSLSVFRVSGRPLGGAKKEYLTLKELKVAQYYVLTNCAEVDKYMVLYAR